MNQTQTKKTQFTGSHFMANQEGQGTPPGQWFLLWFQHALRNEQWRAYLRRQLEQSELPVIEMEAGTP